MLSTQDTILATRTEIWQHGAAQVRGIAGWGRRGARTRESCGGARANRAGVARAGCKPDCRGDARWARRGDQGSGRGERPWRREEVDLVGEVGTQTEASGQTEEREQGRHGATKRASEETAATATA